jgi:PAS domain S-box-containing protein
MLLDQILLHVPCPIFWKNKNGELLGCNKLFLDIAGFNDYNQLIGKKDEELPWRKYTNQYKKDDQKIISTGEIITRIERIPLNGKIIIAKTTKAPLTNDGYIIGILGTCLDITDSYEKEQFKRKNDIQLTALKLQKAIAAEQNKFREIVAQVNHDIRSPLTSLQMLTGECVSILPESERNSYRNAIARITDITNNMMNYFKPNTDVHSNENSKTILVSTELLEILTEKKYEYNKISFAHKFSKSSTFAFVNVESRAFKRMISNIINNAVDATYDKKVASVSLSLDIIDDYITITVKDAGKGMSEETRQKILNNISITTGKKDGYGIGFRQIHDTLSNNNGTLDIKTKTGAGTKITLQFPRVSPPDWIAEKIEIQQDDIIVILDDDPSIHGAWNSRLDAILQTENSLDIKHFEIGEHTISFINSLKPKDKKRVLLLTDYELINQQFNGLNVIENTHIKRSILVTSHHTNYKVLKQAALTNTKVLPKLLAPEIPIIFSNSKKKLLEISKSKKLKTNAKQKVDLIFLDDDQLFVDTMVNFIFKNMTVAVYLKPEELLNNIATYSKNTKVIVDNHYYNSNLKGVEVIEKLYNLGYKNLYLMSGYDAKDIENLPPDVTVVFKSLEDIKKHFEIA